MPLENVISHFLDWLFPEMEIAEQAVFRVTRDGDTEISDDADDLLVAVESELQKRPGEAGALVDDREDARGDRDLGPAKTARISRAVPALVMAGDDLTRQSAEGGDGGDDSLPEQWKKATCPQSLPAVTPSCCAGTCRS